MSKYILFLLFISLNVYGQEIIEFPDKESLSAEIIRAINANDKAGLVNTFHPVFRKAITKDNDVFFNDVITRWLSYTLDPNSQIKYDDVDPESVIDYYKGKMTYPAPQNFGMWIERSKNTKYTNVSVHMSLSHDKYGWYQVSGVPTKEYVKEYTDMMVRRDAFKLKVKKHVEEMDEGLRQEIIALLKENDFFKALELHAIKTGADKDISQQAVRLIRKTEGLEQR